MKKALALIVTILVIFSCFAACGETQGDDTSTTPSDAESINSAEESLDGVKHGSFEKFTTVDLAGNTVTEDIFKGKKLTMINIWATFCRPCIGEMPDLEKISQEYADTDFQVIGIACDVSYSADGYDEELLGYAHNIVDMTEVTFTNLLPSESLDKIKLSEVYSVPETIFVDENGNIVGESFIGSRSYDNWKIIIDSMLEQ